MTQIWRDKEIHPEYEYDSNFKSAFWWGCDDGFTPLPVLINRCQNLIIAKRCRAEDKDFDGIRPVEDIIVHMNQKVFDFFVSIPTFDYKDHFIIEIDKTIQDDMIIVSTLDHEYIESVKIV